MADIHEGCGTRGDVRDRVRNNPVRTSAGRCTFCQRRRRGAFGFGACFRLATALTLWAGAGVAAWAAPLGDDAINVLRERDPRYAMATPSEAALQLAAKMGREGNVDGLRAIIGLRNQSLLFRAVGSYDTGPSKQLPEALEALIVEHYADPLLQRPLLALLAKGLDKYERIPKYRSRKLFDLLYADLKGNDQLHYAIRIVATDLKDIESELVAALPALGTAGANELVMFLGVRKFAAAVPALKELQARTPYERDVNGLLGHINWALLQIGTPQAVQAVLDRMKTLGGRSADPRAASEVWGMLLNLKELPAGSPPDYAQIRAALPAELNDSGWSALVQLIVNRKEKRGIPDLILALIRSPGNDDAVNALLAMGEPEDWRAARAELGRMSGANIRPDRLAALQKRFDDALADTGQTLAKRRQNERQQELQQSETRFNEEKSRLAALRTTDPKRYAADWRALIERHETLLGDYADLPYSTGAKGQLAREYAALAWFLRFTLRKPDEAIAAYQAMAKLQPAAPAGIDFASIAIADVQRFDKRDPRKAIEQYRLLLAGLGAGPSRPDAQLARLFPGLRLWIAREIAYLESGKPFSGVIGRDDLAVVEVWFLLSAMQQETDPALIEALNRMQEAAMRGQILSPAGLLRALDALPASQLHMASAFVGVLQLPPQDILRFFAKHDPAGYLTAAILALAAYRQPQSPDASRGLPNPYTGSLGSPASVKSAADSFFRARGIRVALAADPRYASPDKTWALFIASAKKGDAAAMLACFTSDMRQKLQTLFTGMSAEQLRKMADSFVGFSMNPGSGEGREAVVVRQSGDKNTAGFAYFVNDGGEWKIQSM